MPPIGNAIKGSIFISAIGLKASIIIVTSGPNIDAKKLGSISEDTEISSLFTLSPLLINVLANINVTINPNIAGTIPAAITVVKGNSKASATDIVFGLGEIIFPALPPPIIANKIVGLDKPAFAPIANAIGATVITATSINTPTAVRTQVAIIKATIELDLPILSTIVSAIFEAAPDPINIPAKTPAVNILKTAGIIPSA